MTAQLLTSEIPADVTGWWVSEKLDGVRAIWTGTKLLSRNGKDLKAPANFTKGFPPIRLDGELWMGRGTFNQLVSTIQRKDSNWNGVQYMVFEFAKGGPFEERIPLAITPATTIICVRHRKLLGHDDLSSMELEIVAAGGEGCVIRRPGCKYRPGRMGDVIKVKRLVADVDRWQG